MANIIVNIETEVVAEFHKIEDAVKHFIEKMEGHGHKVTAASVTVPGKDTVGVDVPPAPAAPDPTPSATAS